LAADEERVYRISAGALRRMAAAPRNLSHKAFG